MSDRDRDRDRPNPEEVAEVPQPERVIVTPPVPVPTDGLLASLDPPRFVYGEKRWYSYKGRRIYTWDRLHGEVEVFNRLGHHLGAIDNKSQEKLKPADPTRRIRV